MNRETTDSPGKEGFGVYTPRTLRSYDFIVHGLSNRLAWHCPTRAIQRLYDSHVGLRHLEIGVGTGLFLDRLPADTKFKELVLADPNRACLEKASSRLTRFSPESIGFNLLDESAFLSLNNRQFDSIGLNYVLHCLPGGISNLASFLAPLAAYLNEGGTFFGSTILGREIRANWFARRLMAIYNRRGIFGNENDSLENLEQHLNDQFGGSKIEQHGCVAVFCCRKSW